MSNLGDTFVLLKGGEEFISGDTGRLDCGGAGRVNGNQVAVACSGVAREWKGGGGLRGLRGIGMDRRQPAGH